MLGVSACEKATGWCGQRHALPANRPARSANPTTEAEEGVRVPGAFAFYRRAATVRERLMSESLALVAAGVALMVE